MQAKLPDVNAAIVRYRSQALESVKTNDYDLAIISLAGINADLPEDFKVEVNSDKYYSIIKDRKYLLCTACTEIDNDPKSEDYGKKKPTKCIYSEVIQFDLEVDWLEQILSGQKTKRVWNCTKCGKLNDMDSKNMMIKKYYEPFYTKVMPSPPIQKRGIQGRSSFQNEFRKWFSIANSEIESQISRYRTEYAAQQEQEEVNILED